MIGYIEDFFYSFWSTSSFLDSQVLTEGFWADYELSIVLSIICTIICGGLVIFFLIKFIIWLFKVCSGVLK